MRPDHTCIAAGSNPLPLHEIPEKIRAPFELLPRTPMPSHRLRFELLFALGWIAFGALVLPALVYGVGVALLGAYADGGLAAFYGNLYRDLVTGSLAAATLVFGPYVIVMLARVPLMRRRGGAVPPAGEEDEAPPPSARTRAPGGRIEPRIGN